MSAKQLALIPLLIILTQLYLEKRGEPCSMNDDMDVLKKKLDKCVATHEKEKEDSVKIPQDSKGKAKGPKRQLARVEQEYSSMGRKRSKGSAGHP